ncbi:MAG: tail fiber domain-containing protein, partial [Bacteroidota bacterium]
GASSDVVATSNNGNETTNYVDMGINGGGNTSTGVLGGANTAYLYSTGNDFAIGNGTASKNLNFFTNTGGTNTERMRIYSLGSVGIGTSTFDATNPERLLVDAGSTATDFQNVIVAKGNTNSYVQFNIQNTNASGQASTDIVASADNATETNNYVDLGINSSSYNNGSSSLLNGANNSYLYSKGEDFVIGNASTSKSIIFFTGGDAPANEKFRLNSNGVVMKSDLYPSADNTYLLGKTGARWSAVWSANGTIQTSDMRLKTNIHSLNYGLREVMNMRPVSYNWKDKPNSNHKIGLIAQEVRSLVPEVVIGDESKENLGMNYAELVPVLVKAIQEQQKQIETMAKEIEKLKRKN